AAAQKAMTGLKRKVYTPDRTAHRVYAELYPLYRQLHDSFGTADRHGNCANVMKQLLEIRATART
ncbi:MAG TPA: ribulokinase, partial [Planctomycetota bacterium]|nr:ribulokinase [Planctomycetota bacterium]